MSSLDSTTRVNLGILGTLVSMAAVGAFYFAGLKASFASVDESLQEVKDALERNTRQIADSSKTQAVMDVQIEELRRRILELERRVK